ncbi:MAG: putative membrane protein [Chlamydiales bacterium]|jgi:uncharacterized membrane protein
MVEYGSGGSLPRTPDSMPTPKLQKKRRRKARTRKSFFMRGMAVLLPTVMTIVIVASVLQFVSTYLTSPVNRSIYGFLECNGFGWNLLSLMEIDPYAREFVDESLLPVELVDMRDEMGGMGSMEFGAALQTYRDEQQTFLRDHGALLIDSERLREATQAQVPPILGVLISAMVVLTMGYLASGFLGRRLIAGVDRAFSTIPVVRSVYPYSKQVVDFFMSDNEIEFDTVVAAPYPSKDVWAVGFVTGTGLRGLNEALDGALVSVFIPTSPMPMTGFTVYIESDRLIPLDMTVEEALRVTVSAGVLVPDAQAVARADLSASTDQLPGQERAA